MASSLSSPEEQVLAALGRISSLGVPFCAIYIKMSALSMDNRGYRQLEIVSRLFEPLLNHAQARLFLLSNSDFVLLTAYPIVSMIDNILVQIKDLFTDDVYFLRPESENFSKIFFLDKDRKSLEALLHTEKKPIAEKTTVVPKKVNAPITQELTPDIVESLLYKIEQANPLDFIRRQSVICFAKNALNFEAFQEFYTSVSEIQKIFAADLNLSSNKPLFWLLMETLDIRMMKGLLNLNLTQYPKAVSLNMNVDSVLTPLFDELIKKMPVPLIIEFQIADIFHRFDVYKKACQKLKEHNISYALDGIGINELELLDLDAFDVSYMKIAYSSKLKEEKIQNLLSAFIEKHSTVRFVLTHCFDEDSLLLGCKIGIRLFQGYFIDALCSRMTKEKCTFGQECSLQECTSRRAVLSGLLREQCVHQPHLDIYMPLKED